MWHIFYFATLCQVERIYWPRQLKVSIENWRWKDHIRHFYTTVKGLPSCVWKILLWKFYIPWTASLTMNRAQPHAEYSPSPPPKIYLVLHSTLRSLSAAKRFQAIVYMVTIRLYDAKFVNYTILRLVTLCLLVCFSFVCFCLLLRQLLGQLEEWFFFGSGFCISPNSIHSAVRSRMNGMNGTISIQNRQNTNSALLEILAGKFTYPPIQPDIPVE